MTIWLIMVPFGVATYAMRVAFLFHTPPSRAAPRGPGLLRFVPPAVLAALMLPALVSVRQPLTPETGDQLLAAGLAALMAWRFQNVLLTVASGMVALWSLVWLATVTSFALPLGGLLLAGVGLVLIASRLLVRLRRQQSTLAQPVMPIPVAEPVRPLVLAEPKGR